MDKQRLEHQSVYKIQNHCDHSVIAHPWLDLRQSLIAPPKDAHEHKTRESHTTAMPRASAHKHSNQYLTAWNAAILGGIDCKYGSGVAPS
jgi:hypothetical protein